MGTYTTDELDELLQILGLKFDMRILQRTSDNMKNPDYWRYSIYHPKPSPISTYETNGVRYEVYNEGDI